MPATVSNQTFRHPLDAVVLRVPGVESKAGSDGSLHLRYLVPSRGRLDSFLRKMFKSAPARHLVLDPKGAEFWALVDGCRSLRTIAARLGKRWKMETSEAEDAVILFTKMLMARQLIALEIPASESKPRVAA